MVTRMLKELLLLPNLLSLSRIFLAPIIIYYVSRQDNRAALIALVLMAIAGITDGLDGYFARRFKQVTKVGLMIGELKSNSAYYALDYMRKSGNALLSRLEVTRDGKLKLSLWQRRCYDHNCRSIDTVKEKIAYCHKNPVIRGLVTNPAEWKWSSFNWYSGKQDVPLSMDRLDI